MIKDGFLTTNEKISEHNVFKDYIQHSKGFSTKKIKEESNSYRKKFLL